LVATNKGSLRFFVYGFAKNERSNIDKDEEAALKKWAITSLKMPPLALGKAKKADELMEVNCNA
jgi:hypothetical protein